MLPENIDDLFRDKLDGHETPPGADLWARLQASPAAGPSAEQPADAAPERLDQLFQTGLHAHATPPRRELWERLEDEHLRPRKRRPAAWWPMALAAAVALLLVAGGAGLWLGFPSGSSQSGTVATHQRSSKPAAASRAGQTTPIAAPAAPVQKNVTVQATPYTNLASTAPKARMAAPGQSPRHPLGTSRQPDAATERSPLVARTTARAAARPAPKPYTPTAADEPRLTTNPETLVATSTPTKPVPTPEIVPASATPSAPPAGRLASTGELITVDVRNGNPAPNRSAKAISTALAEAVAPEERRGLGGRLLQQAGHLVRGERLSLAEATGLPENVTLRATLAGHNVTKSIQL